MGHVTAKKQYEDMLRTVAKYQQAAARNNARAARDPVFAARLAQIRQASAHVDAQANQALSDVLQKAAHAQAMGAWEIAAIGAAVGSVAVVAGTIFLWMFLREERAWQEANPVQASLQTGTIGLFGVLGIGVIALGGLLYWDYRQAKLEQQYLPGGGYRQYPFDQGGGYQKLPAKAPRKGLFEEAGADLAKARKELGGAFAKQPVHPELKKTMVAPPSEVKKELSRFHQQVEQEQQAEKRRREAERARKEAELARGRYPSRPFGRDDVRESPIDDIYMESPFDDEDLTTTLVNEDVTRTMVDPDIELRMALLREGDDE